MSEIEIQTLGLVVLGAVIAWVGIFVVCFIMTRK